MASVSATGTLRVSAGISTAGAGGLDSAAAPSGAELRFPSLDGCRALAALAVMATHLGFATGVSLDGGSMTYLGRGDIGVPVFFVLSGFLIYRPFAFTTARGASVPGTGRYFSRRAVRVLPAYWVAVVLGLSLLAVNAGQRSPGEFLRQLLLVQFYPRVTRCAGCPDVEPLGRGGVLPPPPGVAPPGTAGGARQAILPGSASSGARLVALECRLGALLAFVAYGWTIVLHETSLLPAQAGLWLPAHLDWFALGMAAAAVDVHRRTCPQPAGWTTVVATVADSWASCWVVAGALLLIVCTPLVGSYGLMPLSAWQSVAKEALYAAFATTFLLPAFFGDQQGGGARQLLRWRPLAALGRASYGLFLLHQIVIELTLSVGRVPLFQSSHRIRLGHRGSDQRGGRLPQFLPG